MKIAYLASQVTLPGSPIRRSDAFEHDYSMAALGPALTAQGMALEAVSWDAPDVNWAGYAAVIIGTTWDYWDRQGEFLARLEEIEAATRLFNSSSLVAWNSHKGYLRDLEARGARLIPTLWIDKVTPERAADAFDTLGSVDLVFKRQVGAGAAGQYRLKHSDPVPEMPHPMMVQPFLPAIAEEGEISFVMIDGELSHALLKRPAAGDYRIQSSYGGVETPLEPSKADLAAAKAVLATLDETPLYARVDMLRAEDGGLLLMELELIEPYLYPLQGEELGQRLASAVARRL
ncbi:MAG: hypothetical protein MRY64_17175 [Hyphomonadaceae bacterium]|nr:hypothetical protein [Hyphomonadaceae bacterium]